MGDKGSSRKSSRNEKIKDDSSSGFFSLYRFASGLDIFLLCIGTFLAIIHGASGPMMGLIFGHMTNTLMVTEQFLNDTIIDEIEQTAEPVKKFSKFEVYYCIIGAIVLCTSFLQAFCWEFSSERQVHRLREHFFSQILRQDITWFDCQTSGNLTTKLSDDLERVREGMGHKLSMVIQYCSTFVTGITVGLITNVKLTLAVLAISPILVGCAAFMAKYAATSAARELLKYSAAGKIADEVLTSVKTVMAFGGQSREIKRYEEGLEAGRREAMSAYYIMAVGWLAYYFVVYCSYGGTFWFGSLLIIKGQATAGAVFTVLLSSMGGALLLGGALPFVAAVSTAIGSASCLFGIIDRSPTIDPYSEQGLKLPSLFGSIKFEKVSFSYPARPTVPILRDLDLTIQPGYTVAVVGSSGAGKSTLAALLLRFYDPDQGKVLFDGIDVRDLNLQWLRSQIGVVSQEPVLFAVSILENIRYGRDNVSDGDIYNAAKMANAHHFISELPMKYNTQVGERGTQLSGGQKQRIAIARALVRNPQVLLLDEATSALDSQSEAEVQMALDSAMAGRTTIIIAHRLSTIRKAQVIYAMKDGSVHESGNHEELMQRKGLYYSLVTAQSLQQPAGNSPHYNGNPKSPELPLQPNPDETMTDIDLEQKTKNIKDEPVEASIFKVMKANMPEWPWLSLSAIASVLSGCIVPAFAFLYGQIFATFQLRGEDLLSAAKFWSLMFIGLAVAAGGSQCLLVVSMVNAAERLVLRLRLDAFRNILRQAAGWFDLDENASGKLTTRLARDAPMVKMAAGIRAGQIISAMATLTAAVTLALVQGWQLALLLLLAGPIVATASYHEMRLLRKNLKRDADLMVDAGRVASEAIQNVKTVQTLGLEHKFLQFYLKLLEEPFKEAKSQTITHSGVFAFSQSIVSFLHAAAFGYGGYLVQKGEMTSEQLYKVFFVITLSAASIGQFAAYMQDLTRAKFSAGLIFQLIETKTDIDASPSIGLTPEIVGQVSFTNIHFRYPARPDIEVLRGATLDIEAGKSVAVVGASGGGKSTFVSLLLRFYDPQKGAVQVDGMNIKKLNLPHLRRNIGLVTQEPTLFACSIAENIAYGEPTVDMAQVMAAAKTANIHNFITGLPQGYDTQVGDRGTQLSGGQKQRIAIARALLRNPRILVLDEATSALDTESEQKVQAALDNARVGRTCIIIAHRLSTIEKADKIAVLKNGVVADVGTHAELLTKSKLYYDLVRKQR